MITVNIACDLDEPSFIFVALVTRYEIPLFSKLIHSSLDVTISPFSPYTLIVPFFSSLICKVFVL